MSLTRRGFLAASAGLLLSTLVRPAPRRLDLTAFCSPFRSRRYEFRHPFRQGDWLYATNSKVAVRAVASGLDAELARCELPPASALPWWDHDSLRGWQPLRPEVLMIYGKCPTCNGWGVIGNVRDCPQCDGEAPLSCPCNFGVAGDRVCPDCAGDQTSRPVPGLVRIGDRYYSAHEARKFQATGECLWAAVDSETAPLRLRGDGFAGLLMPIDRQSAKQKIAEAAHAH